MRNIMTTHSPSSPQKPILVAGPCAAETPEQIRFSMVEAKKRGVDFLRISLWKPRTKPGFDGMKEAGIPLMAEAARMGVNPGTEILVASQAEAVIDGVLPHLGDKGRLMLWIGARNQNHLVQQEIARAASRDPRICLMLKNQPWSSESHWEGIHEHALEGGIARENIFLCHRGFTPPPGDKSGLRNVADSKMAMSVRNKSGLPMLLDISHIAGCRSRIEEIVREAAVHPYDGLVIEVHPNPEKAWTDATQQITWDTLDKMMALLIRERAAQHDIGAPRSIQAEALPAAKRDAAISPIELLPLPA
jgi:3-deoxy-D-arabino-heptulosonate 7-phosphate (DAHP) synthase